MLGLLVGGLTACHGGVHAQLTVNVGTDARDATPGDGVCEVTAGAGDCTLRAAVDEANALNAVGGTPPAVTIVLAADVLLTRPGLYEDLNSTGDVDIVGSVTILGHGFEIAQQHLDRVLHVRAGTVLVSDVTITGGLTAPQFPTLGSTAADGGGIRAEAGTTLNVVQSRIIDNYSGALGTGTRLATVPPPDCLVFDIAGGGGISSDGALNVAFSTIAGNQVSPTPGVGCGTRAGVDFCPTGFGGGILAGGTLTIVESTISGNTVGEFVNPSGHDSLDSGPGVLVYGTGTITSSTVVDNTPDLTKQVVGATVRGSILVGRTCSATLIDANHNLVSTLPCPGAPADDGDIGNLGANGGPTPTHLPAATSPAADAIPSGTAGLCDWAITADQRGLPRPTTAACDIGAVERQPTDP